MRIAALHETRNNSVEWTLASGEHVGMSRVEPKTGAAVLQLKTHAFDRDSRTKIAEDALNPAHHIAFPVGYGQVGSVAAGDLSRPHLAVCSSRVNHRGAVARMFFRE